MLITLAPSFRAKAFKILLFSASVLIIIAAMVNNFVVVKLKDFHFPPSNMRGRVDEHVEPAGVQLQVKLACLRLRFAVYLQVDAILG